MIYTTALVVLQNVVVAAALSCYGGQIQGKIVLNDEEKVRAKKLGITNYEKNIILKTWLKVM